LRCGTRNITASWVPSAQNPADALPRLPIDDLEDLLQGPDIPLDDSFELFPDNRAYFELIPDDPELIALLQGPDVPLNDSFELNF